MADQQDRIRIYRLSDVGSAGRISQSYVLDPSSASDFAYWAAVSFVSAAERTVGTQAEHVVLYDVTINWTVPLVNTDDVILTLMPAETLRLKVQGVGRLANRLELQARCLDVSDAAYTLTQ